MSELIGVPFMHKGQEIIAVEEGSAIACNKCMYEADPSCTSHPQCMATHRTDKTRVYFLPVQEYMVRRIKGEL